MTLIKLSEDHYVLTDDSDICIGNIVAEKLLTGKYELFTIHTLNDIDKSTQKKITHSTQPLELICCTPEGQIKRYIDCKGCDRGTLGYNEVKPLSLSEVKEVLGIVDVEKKAWKYNPVKKLDAEFIRAGYVRGYNEALEDNKEKKYTEEDMRKAMRFGSMRNKLTISELESSFQQLIQSIQPKTEWEVEMVDGKLKLKP